MATLSVTAADVALVQVIEKFTGPAAEAITAGQYVRLDTSTGKIALGNGTSAAEARKGGIAITSAPAGMTVTAVRKGIVDLGDALGDLTYDDDVFLSDTDGVLADTAGTTSLIVGTVVPVWAATTADKLLRSSGGANLGRVACLDFRGADQPSAAETREGRLRRAVCLCRR